MRKGRRPFQKIDVNTLIKKALELTQKTDEWTWNNDELTPEDVTFDPHNMMLCPPK